MYMAFDAAANAYEADTYTAVAGNEAKALRFVGPAPPALASFSAELKGYVAGSVYTGPKTSAELLVQEAGLWAADVAAGREAGSDGAGAYAVRFFALREQALLDQVAADLAAASGALPGQLAGASPIPDPVAPAAPLGALQHQILNRAGDAARRREYVYDSFLVAGASEAATLAYCTSEALAYMRVRLEEDLAAYAAGDEVAGKKTALWADILHAKAATDAAKLAELTAPALPAFFRPSFRTSSAESVLRFTAYRHNLRHWYLTSAALKATLVGDAQTDAEMTAKWAKWATMMGQVLGWTPYAVNVAGTALGSGAGAPAVDGYLARFTAENGAAPPALEAISETAFLDDVYDHALLAWLKGLVETPLGLVNEAAPAPPPPPPPPVGPAPGAARIGAAPTAP